MSDIQQIQAIESDVIVPLTNPYAEFAEVKKDAVLNGILKIKFPKQCAWCGSETIAGWRSIRLYEANPHYRSKGQQALLEGVALAGAYAVGGSVLSQGLVYSVLKPQDAPKVKGIALHLAVPYCVEHSAAPAEAALNLSSSHLKVRGTEYAELVKQSNINEEYGLFPPNEIVEGIRQSITPKIKLSKYLFPAPCQIGFGGKVARISKICL